MFDPFLRLFGWRPRPVDPVPVAPAPQADPDGIDALVAQHGDAYRDVIEQAVEEVFLRAEQRKTNLATFNFARHVSEVVFLHSIGVRSQV